jgi:hypothetical protein
MHFYVSRSKKRPFSSSHLPPYDAMTFPIPFKLSRIKRLFRKKRRALAIEDVQSPSTPEPAEPFNPTRLSFFSLPRELRDMIYSHAFASDAWSQRCSYTTRPLPLFASPNFKLAGADGELQLGAWILTSQRFFSEAVSLYTKGRVFTVDSGSVYDVRRYLSTPRPRGFFAEVQREGKWYPTPPHVELIRTIRTLRLPALRNHHDGGPMGTMRFSADDVDGLRTLLHVRGRDAAPLELQLDWIFQFPTYPTVSFEAPVFDAWPLDEWSGMFGKVAIKVVVVLEWCEITDLENEDAAQRAEAAVKEELYSLAERWARRLVGGEEGAVGCEVTGDDGAGKTVVVRRL